MTAGAHHLCAIPAEERARGQSHAGRIGDAAQANGLSLTLVGYRTAESEETDGEAPQKLRALCKRRVANGAAVRKIERRAESDSRDEREFGGEKQNAADALPERWTMRSDVGLSEGYGDDGWQGHEREEKRKFKNAPDALDCSDDGSADEIDFDAIRIEGANGDGRFRHGGLPSWGELGEEVSLRGGRCLRLNLRVRLEHPSVG